MDIQLVPFELDRISLVDEGLFTTISNMVFGGEPHGVSLDFDAQILEAIKQLCPKKIADSIENELQNSFNRGHTLTFPQPIQLAVMARLGEIQKAQHEDFIPLVVQSVSKIGRQTKGATKMKKINPIEVLYIKLGRGGEREKECIEEGTLQIGFHDVSHEIYLECLASKKWDEVQKAWQKTGRSQGVATNYANQIRRFYEADKDVLWVTFWKGALWWCFAKPDVVQSDDKMKIRHTVSGWICNDINGQPLLTSQLSGKLLAMQGFRGTICTVREADYLVDKINGHQSPAIKEADVALLKLQEKVEIVIRSLTWQDFELLIDLIFRQAGWQRVSVLGGTMKSLDLDLIAPITNERYGVQVKSEATLSTFKKYKTEKLNDMQGFTQFYFAVHSPASDLSQATDAESDDVKLLLPANIARLAVQYGLAQWVIDKAR